MDGSPHEPNNILYIILNKVNNTLLRMNQMSIEEIIIQN